MNDATVSTGGHDNGAPFQYQVTCTDNGMPLVIMRAGDPGRSSYETKLML